MPLIGSIVPIRNKLVYPAGIAPGFDQNHPASPGCFFSYAGGAGGNTSGFGAINILTGLRATSNSGTVPVASIQGDIGPAIIPATAPAGAGGLAWSTLAFPSSANITMASIFRLNTITSNSRFLMTLGVQIHAFVATSTTGVVAVRIGATTFSTAITLTANVPYFMAVSSVASIANFVILNLAKGSLLTAVNLSTGAPGAASGLVVGDGTTNIQGVNGPIAAAMCSTAGLSFDGLLAWAADPWAFWYPQRPPLWKGTAAAAAAFKAFWARPRNFIQPHGAAS